jgi:hypothetical protein
VDPRCFNLSVFKPGRLPKSIFQIQGRIEMAKKIEIINVMDKFGRRSGIDRRHVYDSEIQRKSRMRKERRSGTDRRSGFDRRSGIERRLEAGTQVMEERRSGKERRTLRVDLEDFLLDPL